LPLAKYNLSTVEGEGEGGDRILLLRQEKIYEEILEF
jgi:hypothetical protein